MSMIPPAGGAPADSPPQGASLAGAPAAARHRIDVSMDGKASQQDAQYVPQSPDPTRECQGCKSFIDPNACQLIGGDISPQGTCTMFEAAGSAPMGAPGSQSPDALPAPTGMVPGGAPMPGGPQ